jgi:hypothetical protein
MEEFKTRLLEETRFEANKLKKLNEFMSGNGFPTLERWEKKMLYKQSRIMNEFVEILGIRLENYGIKFTHKEEK